MDVFQRGVPINLTQRFWVIDPITEDSTLTNPNTVTFTILAPDGTDTVYAYLVDVNVTNPATGIFVCTLPPSLPIGIYHWLCQGTGTVGAQTEDTFQIVESAVEAPAPPPMPVQGPCAQWISGQDVANCARVDYDDTNAYLFDEVAANAYLALYELSGRQWPGVCTRTVRPVNNPSCGCWLGGPISYGFGPWWWSTAPWGFGGWAWANEQGDQKGCSPVSQVNLAGYPVHNILQVLIGGVELPEFDPDAGFRNWRLDGWRYLIRMDTPATPPSVTSTPNFWPGCQDWALDDDQPGTFSVTYQWGIDPPQLAKAAAVEVANQLYLACGGQNCVLPAGVTRVVRQGVEIERGLLANWMNTQQATGLVNLDLFLAAYCQGQRRGRRGGVWSPDRQGFARRVGVNQS